MSISQVALTSIFNNTYYRNYITYTILHILLTIQLSDPSIELFGRSSEIKTHCPAVPAVPAVPISLVN